MSVHVVVRITKTGEKRYLVRTRIGGRYGRILHLGSFRTRRDADACVAWARGELAQGRIPDRRARLREQAGGMRCIEQAARSWLAGRVDVEDSTRETYEDRIDMMGRYPIARIPAVLVGVDDVQRFVADQAAAGVSPATIRRTLSVLRMTLDAAGREPNPARSRLVRVPRDDRDEIEPPTAREVRLILEHVSPKRYRLVLALIEATGLRISDLLGLRWGDVDTHQSRFRVQKTRGKSKRTRFVPVPRELLALVEATCPLEDRAAKRRVFPSTTRESVYDAMARACRNAGIPVHSAHDLRHRCLSRMVQTGEPISLVAEIAGHSKTSMTLDVYSHVLTDTEEAWRWLVDHDASIST